MALGSWLLGIWAVDEARAQYSQVISHHPCLLESWKWPQVWPDEILLRGYLIPILTLAKTP